MKHFLIGISALLALSSPVESMAGCKVEHKKMPCSILQNESIRFVYQMVMRNLRRSILFCIYFMEVDALIQTGHSLVDFNKL